MHRLAVLVCLASFLVVLRPAGMCALLAGVLGVPQKS